MNVALDRKGYWGGVDVAERDLVGRLAMKTLAAQRKKNQGAWHIGGEEEQRASGRMLEGAQNRVGMAHWMLNGFTQ